MDLKEIIIQELKKWNLGICENIGEGTYTRFQFLSKEDINDIAEEISISIKNSLNKKNN